MSTSAFTEGILMAIVIFILCIFKGLCIYSNMVLNLKYDSLSKLYFVTVLM